MNLVESRVACVALTLALAACSQPAADQSTSVPTTDTTEIPKTKPPQSTTSQPSEESATTMASPMTVLVFHKTEGFRHDSIEAGVRSLNELADSLGYAITATEDASVFTPDQLEPFDVVVFLNTTGDVLDDSQQRAMETFIQAGHGYVGVHSAADTEYDWEWYGGLVGAYFDSHPEPQPASVEIAASHPLVEGLPEQFERFDEWYNFRAQPGPGVTVLATLDESSYGGGAMGEHHPIVWAQEYDGGRAVYIGFGHTAETFEESDMQTLLVNAIGWAAG